MLKCEKCGTENEDGSKFCKSCGSALHVEPVRTTNPINNNSTISTVKKVAMWIVIAIVAFITVVILINFIQAKKEDSQIRELRNACANNDAQSCYELGVSDYYGSTVFNSEKSLYIDEKYEALAKGCRLGNKDACREGGYYEQGCELQDGESCYKLAHRSISPKVMECQLLPDSDGCSSILNKQSEYEKKYYDLACDYGYSQGCMSR